MGYEWVTGINNGPPDGDLSPWGNWLSDDGSAVTALSVPSPNGYGDIMERVEVAIDISTGCVDSTLLGFFLNSAITLVAGDVGPVGGTPPDPASVGGYPFAFTTQVGWIAEMTVWDFLSGYTPTIMRASTHGYVTSRARRGPESYGSVDPAFNLGIVTRGWEYRDPTVGAVSDFWSITARVLWRTP